MTNAPSDALVAARTQHRRTGGSSVVVDARMLEHSGIGTYLAGILKGWRNRADYLSLIHPDPVVAGSVLPDAEIRISASPIYSVAEQLDRARLSFGRETVFWCPHFNIPVLTRSKLVVTVHDVLHLAHPEFFPGWHKRAYAKAMFSAIAAKAARIICVSEFTKEELERFAGISPDRVTVIPNGVDESWFRIQPGERPHSSPYLLFVGSVKPHKNLGRLIKAFSRIAPHCDHDLIIVGKREGLVTLDHQAMQDAEKLGRRVRFTGRVSEDLLRQYYLHATAVAFPTLYEGFGLPALEAMACGRPVVVSDIPPLPEVCGNAAIYCDPYSVEDIAEKIEFVLNLDLPTREDLVLRGMARAASLRWDECAERTWKVLQSC